MKMLKLYIIINKVILFHVAGFNKGPNHNNFYITNNKIHNYVMLEYH